MPIKVTCSNCGGVLHAPDDAAGKRGRCPTCGTVLTITGDAPRVAGNATVPPPVSAGPLEAASRPVPVPPRPGGGPGPGLSEASSGIPIGPRPLAEPDGSRAPAFPRSVAPAPSTAAASRIPPGPAKVSDPFAKAGRSPDPYDPDVTARGWARVRRGLGWVQAAVFFKFLALAACPGIEVAQQYGVKLPDKDTGFLKLPGLPAADEIRLLAIAIPIALAALCAVVGRFGAASAPRSSFARGMATAAAWATLLAVLGLAATASVTALAAESGNVPRFVPDKDVTKPGVVFQVRVEKYLRGVFVLPEDPSGQAQRVGLLALVVFGLVAEVWFLNALGRFAAALQSPGASRRVTGFLVLVGGLVAVGLIAYLVHDLSDKAWVNAQVWPKWDNLGQKNQMTAVGGAIIVVALFFAVLYYRMLGGVKRAIRETYDAYPAG